MSDELVRILISFLAGYFLSTCGSICQGVSSNVMSSPSTLGFNALSVVFVLVIYVLGHFVNINMSFDHAAFSLSVITLSFIFLFIFINIRLFKFKFLQNWSKDKLILIGLCINLLIGAIFSLLQFLSMSVGMNFPSALWYGSFKYAESGHVFIFVSLLIITIAFLLFFKKTARYLILGHSYQASLNIQFKPFVVFGLLLVFLMTSAITSYYGVFPFLGLIFPNIVRRLPWFKHDYYKELLFGGILAGVILSAFDFLCYQLPFKGAEVPVGMISSLLGSIFLILTLLASKHKKTV